MTDLATVGSPFYGSLFLHHSLWRRLLPVMDLFQYLFVVPCPVLCYRGSECQLGFTVLRSNIPVVHSDLALGTESRSKTISLTINALFESS